MNLKGTCILAGKESKEFDGKHTFYIRFQEENGTFYETTTKDINIFGQACAISQGSKVDISVDSITKPTSKGLYKSNELLAISAVL